jgi:hypothetical protein
MRLSGIDFKIYETYHDKEFAHIHALQEGVTKVIEIPIAQFYPDILKRNSRILVHNELPLLVEYGRSAAYYASKS